MEIIKGKHYKCIKDVKMANGEIAFYKDKLYIANIDGCLKNEYGDIEHSISSEYADEHFIEVLDNSVKQINHKSGIDIFDIVKYHNYIIGNAIIHLLNTGYNECTNITQEINELNLVKSYIDEQINLLSNKK